MIWRDDDISLGTNLPQLRYAHNILVKYGKVHTITLICKGINHNPALIYYILDDIENFDVQLHCWEHVDYSLLSEKEISTHIKKCLCTTQTSLFITPTIFYPPWNRTGPELEKVCRDHGLTVSNKKVSLSGYIKTKPKEGVINFHHWADEVLDLEKALLL